MGKPERDFFRLALEDMGLEPHEVAMVGDDAEADVAGAQAAGLIGFRSGQASTIRKTRRGRRIWFSTASRSYPWPSDYRRTVGSSSSRRPSNAYKRSCV